jgi:hypothetical protein
MSTDRFFVCKNTMNGVTLRLFISYLVQSWYWFVINIAAPLNQKIIFLTEFNTLIDFEGIQYSY